MQWSPSEKAVAGKPFNQALEQELEEVMHDDRKYDDRYSVLPMVFANLLSEGRVTEDDLRGHEPEKLAIICHLAGVD
jgi:hypothetical protein